MIFWPVQGCSHSGASCCWGWHNWLVSLWRASPRHSPLETGNAVISSGGHGAQLVYCFRMWGSLFSEVAVLDWNRVDWGRGSRRQKENIWKEINTSTHCSALYSSLYFMITYWTNKTLPIDEWRNKLRLRHKLWHRSAITAPDAYIHLAKQIVSPWLSRHNISYRYTNWAHGLCTNTTTGSAIGPYQ